MKILACLMQKRKFTNIRLVEMKKKKTIESSRKNEE